MIALGVAALVAFVALWLVPLAVYRVAWGVASFALAVGVILILALT